MENEEYNDQVEGRNAVLELLESGRDINKILVANGEKHGSIHKILAIAKERKIIVMVQNEERVAAMSLLGSINFI